jgi:hypothetical protein
MVDNSDGRKKSNFVAKTSVTAGAYMDFFVNSTNYKISYADFLSGLGVTGSLETLGAVSGIAILDVSGTVNRIRNIENGSGIIASVSASQGCEVAHNFLSDGTGHAVFKDITAAQPTFASLVAGTGISIATTDNYITISKVADTIVDGLVSMQDNATATTIAVTSTPVLVAGTWVSQKTSTVTATTAGRLTYTGGTAIDIKIDASISLAPSSASAQNLSLFIAKNGTVIAGSEISSVVTTAVEQSLSTSWVLSFATNDYVELFVQNDTSTDNIVVSRATFRTS